MDPNRCRRPPRREVKDVLTECQDLLQRWTCTQDGAEAHLQRVAGDHARRANPIAYDAQQRRGHAHLEGKTAEVPADLSDSLCGYHKQATRFGHGRGRRSLYAKQATEKRTVTRGIETTVSQRQLPQDALDLGRRSRWRSPWGAHRDQ